MFGYAHLVGISSSFLVSFHFSQSFWLANLIGSSVNNPGVFSLAPQRFFSFATGPPGLILVGRHREHVCGFGVKSFGKRVWVRL